ncbi:MAG TPA: hypothetical protein VK893_06730 [Pyrinomonadaceae bacterium]|nr:hypothetical protein [Pyrinomonadaceae bacterium]
MRRLFLLVSGAVFLLTTLLGAGVAVLLKSSTVTAQDAQSERVIRNKRIPSPSFELEVLVDGRPLREYHSRGRTYVEGLRGEEYELRLRNSSAERVAVALSVDGLNTIDARQTSPWNSSKWVIEPYQTITIAGWQMSSERARRFYFTTERDSYAAKLGQRGNPGVISAVFFRERNRPVPIIRPRPNPSTSDAESMGRAEAPASAKPAGRDNRAARRESEAATGIGRSVRNDVEWVEMELDSRPVAELTVRYEYSKRRYTSGPFSPDP